MNETSEFPSIQFANIVLHGSKCPVGAVAVNVVIFIAFHSNKDACNPIFWTFLNVQRNWFSAHLYNLTEWPCIQRILVPCLPASNGCLPAASPPRQLTYTPKILTQPSGTQFSAAALFLLSFFAKACSGSVLMGDNPTGWIDIRLSQN